MFSPRFSRKLDLITLLSYGTSRKICNGLQRKRAVENLYLMIRVWKGKNLLFQSWIPVPILLPGEKRSTRIETEKVSYARPSFDRKDGRSSIAAIAMGYPWGRRTSETGVINGSLVIVKRLVKGGPAEYLAKSYLEVRNEFGIRSSCRYTEESFGYGAGEW